MKIYKYPIMLQPYQVITMPLNHKILLVQVQHGRICLWALVDPESIDSPVGIRIYATGFDDIDEPGELNYIGSVQMENGNFVWHVFEEK